jgi:CheY-like chemotaxis protein
MTELGVILLVEDREDDVLLIQRSFERAKLSNPFHVVRDGVEAIDYLAGEGAYANRREHPLPDLILLDLKMPKVDGFEVLAWIRAQPTLKSIPVLVLTSSQQLKDVNRAYEMGANSFLVKPLDFDGMCSAASLIRDYWLKTSKTPQSARRPSEDPREVRKRDSNGHV